MTSTTLPQTNIKYRGDETVLDITTESHHFRFVSNPKTEKIEVLLVDENKLEILLNSTDKDWEMALESLEASQTLLAPAIYEEIMAGITIDRESNEPKLDLH